MLVELGALGPEIGRPPGRGLKALESTPGETERPALQLTDKGRPLKLCDRSPHEAGKELLVRGPSYSSSTTLA